MHIKMHRASNVVSIRDDDERRLLAEEILDYLRHNPNAADALEGIARWWLRRRHGDADMDQVQKALDYLVEKGLLQSERKRSGELIYKLA